MPIYCYRCECGYEGEELCNLGQHPLLCKECGGKYITRDYMAEKPVIRPDWEPGFNASMGIKYSGRKDLMTKARAAGFYMYGHGGSVFSYDKTFYGDEEYHRKFTTPPGSELKRVHEDELIQKGLEDTEKQDKFWVPEGQERLVKVESGTEG